ncbi:hypothetical protein B0J11DRAFT_522356 [Dendryphion nanum]|uniref:SH3 domain-containing protein n=1 Tax=Dendryphion nanum TaxID=256645 RepID=A0A9P9IT57_9PLEO|nr:hypothetical protein B0J11DRAFT_522356 [Dendryphion nanum]
MQFDVGIVSLFFDTSQDESQSLTCCIYGPGSLCSSAADALYTKQKALQSPYEQDSERNQALVSLALGFSPAMIQCLAKRHRVRIVREDLMMAEGLNQVTISGNESNTTAATRDFNRWDRYYFLFGTKDTFNRTDIELDISVYERLRCNHDFLRIRFERIYWVVLNIQATSYSGLKSIVSIIGGKSDDHDKAVQKFKNLLNRLTSNDNNIIGVELTPENDEIDTYTLLVEDSILHTFLTHCKGLDTVNLVKQKYDVDIDFEIFDKGTTIFRVKGGTPLPDLRYQMGFQMGREEALSRLELGLTRSSDLLSQDVTWPIQLGPLGYSVLDMDELSTILSGRAVELKPDDTRYRSLVLIGLGLGVRNSSHELVQFLEEKFLKINSSSLASVNKTAGNTEIISIFWADKEKIIFNIPNHGLDMSSYLFPRSVDSIEKDHEVSISFDQHFGKIEKDGSSELDPYWAFDALQKLNKQRNVDTTSPFRSFQGKIIANTSPLRIGDMAVIVERDLPLFCYLGHGINESRICHRIPRDAVLLEQFVDEQVFPAENGTYGPTLLNHPVKVVFKESFSTDTYNYLEGEPFIITHVVKTQNLDDNTYYCGYSETSVGFVYEPKIPSSVVRSTWGLFGDQREYTPAMDAVAIEDLQATEIGQLSLSQGQRVQILGASAHAFLGQYTLESGEGVQGVFPKKYVRMIDDAENSDVAVGLLDPTWNIIGNDTDDNPEPGPENRESKDGPKDNEPKYDKSVDEELSQNKPNDNVTSEDKAENDEYEAMGQNEISVKNDFRGDEFFNLQGLLHFGIIDLPNKEIIRGSNLVTVLCFSCRPFFYSQLRYTDLDALVGAISERHNVQIKLPEPQPYHRNYDPGEIQLDPWKEDTKSAKEELVRDLCSAAQQSFVPYLAKVVEIPNGFQAISSGFGTPALGEIIAVKGFDPYSDDIIMDRRIHGPISELKALFPPYCVEPYALISREIFDEEGALSYNELQGKAMETAVETKHPNPILIGMKFAASRYLDYSLEMHPERGVIDLDLGPSNFLRHGVLSDRQQYEASAMCRRVKQDMKKWFLECNEMCWILSFNGLSRLRLCSNEAELDNLSRHFLWSGSPSYSPLKPPYSNHDPQDMLTIDEISSEVVEHDLYFTTEPWDDELKSGRKIYVVAIEGEDIHCLFCNKSGVISKSELPIAIVSLHERLKKAYAEHVERRHVGTNKLTWFRKPFWPDNLVMRDAPKRPLTVWTKWDIGSEVSGGPYVKRGELVNIDGWDKTKYEHIRTHVLDESGQKVVLLLSLSVLEFDSKGYKFWDENDQYDVEGTFPPSLPPLPSQPDQLDDDEGAWHRGEIARGLASKE